MILKKNVKKNGAEIWPYQICFFLLLNRTSTFLHEYHWSKFYILKKILFIINTNQIKTQKVELQYKSWDVNNIHNIKKICQALYLFEKYVVRNKLWCTIILFTRMVNNYKHQTSVLNVLRLMWTYSVLSFLVLI